MLNIISFDVKTALYGSLTISNGGTDVFINILALSGYVIAKTESEKRLIVYLSENEPAGKGLVTIQIRNPFHIT